MIDPGTVTDLDRLDPQPRMVPFAGVDYPILPLEIGRLPAFSREASHVISYVTLVHADILAYLVNLPEKANPDIKLLLPVFIDIMGNCGDHLIEAVAVATGIPADTLRKSTEYAQLLEAVFAVVTVNVGFFAGAVGPLLKLAVARLAAAAVGIDLKLHGTGSIASTS